MSSSARRKERSTTAPTPSARPSLLLAWYDRHRRRLPWRAAPGQASDPYRVWLSEIMLQQTTVKAVGPYFEKFVARWPDVTALGRASQDDVLRMWAGLGYYSRARNLYACAVAVTREHGGIFPDTEEGLRALPGIGPYTAAAIAAIAFDRRTMPVDGNIERVVSRLFAVEEALPQAKPLIQQLAATLLADSRAGDSAQALMDLGASICTPKKPACSLCPLNEDCIAYAQGTQETFPRKAPKKSGTLRRGAAFVVSRGDELLVRSRPEKGLLGGMTEVPGSDWLAGQDDTTAKRQAPELKGLSRWQRKAGVVTHVFTHFPLELVVYTAKASARTRAPEGMRWVPTATLADEALPNVMRKVIAHALDLAPPRPS
ncbi:A/G-specific adenine glycosylase [Bradyrhizobium sp. WBOS7]|uniref:Adenine DNA glycosylase n=1 Tax=Bradyrhizobium betae TaxID=244734 RepID=A0AAE9SV35_9BRAD|nr:MULTISPECIES: A/G-specific adenine glycosylase [Bradyrhizobium]MDD1574091.1 A/G-specific adenine glycosylase [Bradyrhizobium sp. WBOS1]UUO38651.1 A/G-specific adenine glycosylase [Bradyrhizobium sp. WBOS01]MDD1530640.1 A/G-specific adenine glycosylase [Bradyrhizobium sp. WBOS2]MDD1580041.1 A/G-specific adenine glycosylase [Bradyrhizobium sp. WBOS7]MDD1604348.1 A/G-specific adenine glycosylase [Bradyrhizobium sp. WBOS16]